MHPISPNRPHSNPPGVTHRAPAPTRAPSALLQGPPAGPGVNPGATRGPIPTASAPSRGGDLERPLGDHHARQGEDGAGHGPQRPGFGSSMVRRLRATEERLTQALNNRGERALVNSMDNDDIIDRSIRVHKLGLDRLFPLPGMKRSMKAILETYNAKYPGLEAGMFTSMQKAMRTATKSLAPGQTLRGLAMQNAYHAVAVEFRCHADNRISMLVLDGMKAEPEQMAAFAEALGKSRHNRGGRIDAALFCGLDVQKDHSSCAGYSKDFLKEFHRRGAEFGALHAATRAWSGSAQVSGLPPGFAHFPGDAPIYSISPDKTQHYLPLPLFKNVQSAERLAEIINTRPSSILQTINARGETIPDRLERLTGREWISWHDRSGRFLKKHVPIGDKVVPMAENYRRMHGKAAEYGETGRVRRHGGPDSPDRPQP